MRIRRGGGIGFKDLQNFNVALLAKQLWRLITEPNALMCRVLKQKYYPKGNLLEAKVPAQASWLWKSWTSARFLITEGCAWKIGDGRTVRIWEDRWLLEGYIPNPISLRPANCRDCVVADLKNLYGEGRDMAKLQQLFSSEEVRQISSTAFSALGTKDRII